ncbi:MAG: hypothetical protein ACRBM6_20855 [Geminicoccales bacterium]
MIKLHCASFASSISTFALLGWLAFDQASPSYAVAAREMLIEFKGWPQPFIEQDEALELLETSISS